MGATSESKHLEHTVTTAFGPPFDDTDADLLRSSDQVDFMVYKVILSKASPFFKNMFSLPQPQPATGTPQESRPIIDLAEDSRALAALLSIIYPPSSVTTGSLSLNDLISTLEMARKYDMATVSSRLLLDFKDSKVVRDNPVEAFCAAYSRGWGEAACIAARASLKHRLTLDDVGEKLQYLNGPAFHALWKFHRACSAAAVSAISDNKFKWITLEVATWAQAYFNCLCKSCLFFIGPELTRRRANNASWGSYIDRAREILNVHPCSEAITQHEILLPSLKAKMCDVCRESICRGLLEFSRYLREEVERLVSNVRCSGTLLVVYANLLF